MLDSFRSKLSAVAAKFLDNFKGFIVHQDQLCENEFSCEKSNATATPSALAKHKEPTYGIRSRSHLEHSVPLGALVTSLVTLTCLRVWG